MRSTRCRRRCRHGTRTRTLTFDANSTFGASLTAEQLGFVDPNGCGLKSLTWTGGCGTAPGATMTCPAGANAVSVAASNNGVTYSATIDFQIAVTDFALSVSPDNATVSAGQSSRHVVTVLPQGGAYNSDVTLSCSSGNLPPQTTCAFDPPTVTPRAAGAQSTLTISTASTAAARPPRRRASGRCDHDARVGHRPLSVDGDLRLADDQHHGAGAAGVAHQHRRRPAEHHQHHASGDFATVSNCGTVVAAGASCGVSVTFTPTATGARTGTLSFVDDASGSPQAVTLNGTGQAAPSTTGGTPSGSYTVTISGTAGTSVAHFGTVTLTVK